MNPTVGFTAGVVAWVVFLLFSALTRHRVAFAAGPEFCHEVKTMPFLLADRDPSNYEPGDDAHLDTEALRTAFWIQLVIAVGAVVTSMSLRRRHFPKI